MPIPLGLLLSFFAARRLQVILLQELFSTQYFCQEQREQNFSLAESESESPLLERFQGLAKELGVVRPTSPSFSLSEDLQHRTTERRR